MNLYHVILPSIQQFAIITAPSEAMAMALFMDYMPPEHAERLDGEEGEIHLLLESVPETPSSVWITNLPSREDPYV